MGGGEASKVGRGVCSTGGRGGFAYCRRFCGGYIASQQPMLETGRHTGNVLLLSKLEPLGAPRQSPRLRSFFNPPERDFRDIDVDHARH